jgi:hypothetical protein
VPEAKLSHRFRPVVKSSAYPFATLVQSDFGGRRRRERLVLRGEPGPSWLRDFMPRFPHEVGTVVVAARGKAPGGATTRIRSIIVYPSTCGEAEQAFVYVEEWETGLCTKEGTAAFHVVCCGPLPRAVRFVEVPRVGDSRSS